MMLLKTQSILAQNSYIYMLRLRVAAGFDYQQVGNTVNNQFNVSRPVEVDNSQVSKTCTGRCPLSKQYLGW